LDADANLARAGSYRDIIGFAAFRTATAASFGASSFFALPVVDRKRSWKACWFGLSQMPPPERGALLRMRRAASYY